jgi:gliding motility-associated-like protein
MHVLRSTFLFFAVLFISHNTRAQVLFCPENSGLEYGNFSNWLLYTGSCCPIVTNNFTGPLPNRHVITNTGGIDPYGFFPTVSPGGGNHSMKLGNDNVNSQAERARFYVHVPAGTSNYSLVYRYAVVFEDPGHLPSEQPRFEVTAIDSATNQILPCANFIYVAGINAPGFQESTIADSVWYKEWTTATLNLSGWEGHTIAIDFKTGDCDLGAHFGYGYVDMSCGLFQVAGAACGSTTTTFTAPPGFEFYTWYDDTYSTVVGSGQVITIPTPPLTSVYHVILTPYSGFGCPDTITTTVNISNIAISGSNDTTVCPGTSVPLQSNAVGNMAPFTYSWTPSTGLSCTNCANPIATVNTTTTYYITATDTVGCSKMDTITVNVSPITNISIAQQNVNCYNGNTGSATATVTGAAPFTYTWSTIPQQTTPTATNLTAGTYTLSVNNAYNCPQTAIVTIGQPANLTATMASTPVNCNGQSNGSAFVVPAGGTPPYTYSWNTNPVQTTQNISNIPGEPVSVTVTDAHGCIVTGNITIVQPTVLNANITNVVNAFCTSQPIGQATVAGSGGTPPYTYSWNTNPIQTTPTATNLGNGNYVVTVIDAHGCIDTAHVSIIQTPGLSITMSQANVVCNGNGNGSATVVANNGSSPFTYTWSNGGTNPSISNLTPGTYTVHVSDNTGCSANGSVTITQPSLLNAIVANLSNISCYGLNNGSATMAVLGGSPAYTYLWNTVPQQTTAQPGNLPPGTYLGVVTDSHGCKDSVEVTIQQPTQLNVTITNPVNATCGLPNGSATASASGGTAPYTYHWNTSPVQTDSIADNISAGTYTVTVTDSKGCIDNAVVTLTQSPAVYVNTTPDDVSCHGLSNGSVTASLSGGTQPITYIWSNAQTGLTINNLVAGSYTIIATDNLGCKDTSVATVNEPAVLTTAVTNVENIHCYGEHNGSATITANGGTQPYSYAWNNGGNVANPNNMDTGWHTVIITDANGCADTQAVHITQPPQLFLTANATGSSCTNEPTGSAISEAVGGASPYTIIWNSNPPQTGTTATALAPGTYTVTVTDSNGCIRTNSVNIPSLPQPTVNAGPDQLYCDGKDTLILTASGTIHYLWTPGESLMCDTCAITGAHPGATTTYEVTGTDENGCKAKDQVTITVYNREPMSAGNDIDICHGDSAVIYANGGNQYYWTPAPEGSETSTSSFTVYPENTTSYTVIVYQNECFSDTFTQRVNVWEYPTVQLGPDQQVLPGTIVDIPADTTNATSIIWDPLTNLSCGDCINPSARIDNTITYIATVYNKACKATDDITFRVSCDGGNIFMANTFTPNGDGNNDIFFPQTPGKDIIKVFRVYNRWGQMLHERTNFFSNDTKYGWDGTYEGKMLSPDVYVYFLETACPGGERVFLKGDISLIK